MIPGSVAMTEPEARPCQELTGWTVEATLRGPQSIVLVALLSVRDSQCESVRFGAVTWLSSPETGGQS